MIQWNKNLANQLWTHIVPAFRANPMEGQVWFPDLTPFLDKTRPAPQEVEPLLLSSKTAPQFVLSVLGAQTAIRNEGRTQAQKNHWVVHPFHEVPGDGLEPA